MKLPSYLCVNILYKTVSISQSPSQLKKIA